MGIKKVWATLQKQEINKIKKAALNNKTGIFPVYFYDFGVHSLKKFFTFSKLYPFPSSKTSLLCI